MYSLAIHFYAFIIALISPFHKKARMMRLGQWKTNSILREKIDRNAKYIWFHASSLGEFEQGRPMMEKSRRNIRSIKYCLLSFRLRDMKFVRIITGQMSFVICPSIHLTGLINS